MAKNPELEIILYDIEKIKPYESNPRNNEETVKALQKAISKYGFNQPIVIDKKGVIVKGHARWKAAKDLGMKQIPVIISRRSDKFNRADRIVDNQIHDLTKWDEDALQLEMRDIEEAIEKITGGLDKEYAVRDVDIEVHTKDIERAREKLEQGKQRRLIKITCKCGAEMFLDRNAVEGLV